MNEAIAVSNEHIPSDQQLEILQSKFDTLYELLEHAETDIDLEDISHVVEVCQGLFDPAQRNYNEKRLQEFYKQPELADLLESGDVIGFLLAYQTKDTKLGFAFMPPEEEFLRNLAEQLYTAENFESVSDLGIESVDLRVRLKMAVTDELRTLLKNGEQASTEFSLLEDDQVSPAMVLTALQSWEAEAADFAKHIPEDDFDSIEDFLARDENVLAEYRKWRGIEEIETEASDDDEETNEEQREVITQEPTSTSQELLTELLEEPKLEVFIGLSEEVQAEYVRARAEYFTYYIGNVKLPREARDGASLQEKRLAYEAALGAVAAELRATKVADAAGQDYLIMRFLDETPQLGQIHAAAARERDADLYKRDGAEVEKVAAKKEKVKRRMGWRLLLGGLALGSLQGDQTTEVSTDPVDTPDSKYDTQFEGEISSPEAPIVTPEGDTVTMPEANEAPPEVERVFAYATAEGANQMFLDFLNKVREVEPNTYNTLVRRFETPVMAAERLAQETGFWELTDHSDSSVILSPTDYLTTSEAGDLVFVRGDETIALTNAGERIKQESLAMQTR